MADVDKALPNVEQTINIPSRDELQVEIEKTQKKPQPPVEVLPNEDGSVDINFDPSKRELTNKLEQLRFLDNGLNIYVSYYDKNIPHGIDTQEDLDYARFIFDYVKR